MRPPEALEAAVAAVAPIPRGRDDVPVFRSPWEAQVFGLAVALHDKGLFTWTEWAGTLGQAIRHGDERGDPSDGSAYYEHWLGAIETLVAAKGVASPAAPHPGCRPRPGGGERAMRQGRPAPDNSEAAQPDLPPADVTAARTRRLRRSAPGEGRGAAPDFMTIHDSHPPLKRY